MAQFLVINDYQDESNAIEAGNVISDDVVPVEDMIVNGLACVPYIPAEMADVVTRYQIQRATELGHPSLTALLFFAQRPV